MPKVFGHPACLCPVVCYILHLIQIEWIDFSLCCIVYPVGFLLAIPPPFPLMFFSVKVTCLFSLFCGGSWMGCAVVPAIRGGGGVVQFIGWLPKVKAPDTSGTQPPFSDSAVNKIVFKIRY